METNITHYKARWIYPVDSPPIENGLIAVSQGKIVSLGKERTVQAEIHGKPVDLGEGVIFPALINAHTHLDLSVLNGRLDPGLGFLEWVKRLLAVRESLPNNDRLSGIAKAIEDVHQSGTIAVGDWTGSSETDGFNRINGLVRCAFFEIIGFSEQTFTLPKSFSSNSKLLTLNSELPVPDSAVRNPRSAINWLSLGAHAPHSTSAQLIKAAKTWTTDHRRPLSIHVAESIEEEEFLFTGQGPWREFLRERGKWPGQWKAPGLTSVGYLDSLGVLDEKTVCVHLTRAGHEDLRLLKKNRVPIVLCPRSNHFISRSLPPLFKMLQLGLNPALGTDSLASNHDLNLWEEMAFVHQAFPEIAPENILQMATLNGARSIGLEEKLGSLSPGKRAALLFLPLAGSPAKELPEAILYSRGKGLQWIDEDGAFSSSRPRGNDELLRFHYA